MEKPLVSVIMPVYNGEKYIGKAIESVLAQKVPTELLVIDDCSTDKTELTVMKYMDSPFQKLGSKGLKRKIYCFSGCG